jgi:hypothetical protein
MTLGFWAMCECFDTLIPVKTNPYNYSPMGNKIGYHYMSITLALIGLVTFIPVIYLMYQGKNIRERMGQPNFNRGL